MAVEEKAQTDEQKAAEAEEVKGLRSKLLRSLDAEADAPAEDEEPGAAKADEAEDADAEAAPADDADADAEADEKPGAKKGGAEDEAEDEGELIPRSKVDRMLQRQERRIGQLTAEVRQLRAAGGANGQAAGADPERAKLERMGPAELIALKREVRVAQAREKDDAKLEQLVDLEMKIDEVQRDAPVQFAQRQVQRYNEAADAILEDEDIGDVEEAAPVIRKTAQTIYSRYPKLHHLEEGQAIALQLAAEHYKAVRQADGGKAGGEKVAALKAKLNTLKRKTGLDASRSRSLGDGQEVTKLRERAFRGADDRDRLRLISKDPAFGIDAMIPDEFKE